MAPRICNCGDDSCTYSYVLITTLTLPIPSPFLQVAGQSSSGKNYLYFKLMRHLDHIVCGGDKENPDPDDPGGGVTWLRARACDLRALRLFNLMLL